VETALFFIFGVTAIAGALGVVLARNPVHSALFLVQTLVSIAVYFILQEAELLAAVQVIVYAGAIVVLFLFVIMLIGVDRQEDITAEPIPFQRPLAVVLGVAALVELLVLAGSTWATGQQTSRSVPVRGGEFGNNVDRVARVLFTDFLWPFELTALLLVIAVVGGVALARRSRHRPPPTSVPADTPDEVTVR
jgi:NADH-quinone oxidoreductase subunit J